jgi:hypothetical protein
MLRNRSLDTTICNRDDTLSGQIDSALNKGIPLRLRMSLLKEIPWSVGAILEAPNLREWVETRLTTPATALPGGSLVTAESSRVMDKVREMIMVCYFNSSLPKCHVTLSSTELRRLQHP